MNPGTKSSSPPSSSDNSEPLSFEKVWRMFQDTRDLFTEQAKESDRKLKEAAEQVRETSREVAKIDRQFNTQWGEIC
jgi:hypothetical protein